LSQLSLIKKSSGVRLAPGPSRGLRAAVTQPKSWDAKSRTFEGTLASETPCRTYRLTPRWDVVEVEEVLPMSALVDVEKLVGAPLLDSHSYWQVSSVVGVVEAAEVRGSGLWVRLRLSDRTAVDGIATDIESGILNSLSVGFEILDDGEVVERAGKLPLVTVRKWRAHEASLVAIPADETAKIRSAVGATSKTVKRLNSMPMDADTFRARAAELFAGLADEMVNLLADDSGDETTGTQTTTVTQTDDTAGGLTAAQRTAKLRSIRDVCKKRGFEAEFSALEATDASLDKFQDLLIASLRTSDTEIDTTARPGAGQRGKLLSFSETTRGKAAK